MISQPQSGSAIFHRSLTKKYPVAASGQGVYIIRSDGSKILDGSSGAAVSCLGHGHQVVIEAIVEQARNLAFVHTSFFTSHPAEELASLLLKTGGGVFSKVMFLSSGKKTLSRPLHGWAYYVLTQCFSRSQGPRPSNQH